MAFIATFLDEFCAYPNNSNPLVPTPNYVTILYLSDISY